MPEAVFQFARQIGKGLAADQCTHAARRVAQNFAHQPLAQVTVGPCDDQRHAMFVLSSENPILTHS